MSKSKRECKKNVPANIFLQAHKTIKGGVWNISLFASYLRSSRWGWKTSMTSQSSRALA